MVCQKFSIRRKNLILLKDFPFKLPKIFIDLLKISDGGRVDYVFDYYDEYFQELLRRRRYRTNIRDLYKRF